MPDASKSTSLKQSRLQMCRQCVVSALGPAFKTGLWLLSITVPVSFAVMILKVTGGLTLLARLFAPLFALIGLPGESAVVFATAALLNIYSCIAVIDTLGLAGRTVTILALMCLISHSLPVESAVQKKTGSSLMHMVVIRLGASLVGALVLNALLPPDAQPVSALAAVTAAASFATELAAWLASISWLCVKLMVLVTVLMIVQRLLEAFGVTAFLSRLLRWPLMLLGVPPQAAFLWIVANTLGLSYGAGVIVDHVEHGRLSAENANILNHHIAISHSLLEDTCLFVALGVSAWWITIPRVVLAGIVVWLKRLVDWIAGRPMSAAPSHRA